VLGAASLAGVAFSPYLVTHWPLLLIAMSPLGRHLVLVAPVVHPGAFLVVVIVRRLLFYLGCFHVGRALGPWGIPWLEARAERLARFVRFMERLFLRAPRVVVLALAGPTVAALAGMSPMRPLLFGALAALNLAVRAVVTLGFAALLREYIELALAWINAYWLSMTILTASGVLVYWLWRNRK
jgi:hypothetical protein